MVTRSRYDHGGGLLKKREDQKILEYRTKSEASCKLGTLGHNDVSARNEVGSSTATKLPYGA